jgi:Tol biopolymer transport system component
MLRKTGTRCLLAVIIWFAVAAQADNPAVFSLRNSALLFGTYDQLQVALPDSTTTINPPEHISANSGYFAYPSISPKGDLIAWGFASQLPQKDGTSQYRVKYTLGIYSLANREWKTFGEFEGLGSVSATSFSPDSTHLAFVGKRSGRSDLLILDMADGSIKSVPHPPIWYRSSVSWSPDSRHIALTSTQPSKENPFITVVDVITGEIETLGEGIDPTWSPNGKWIAYFDPSGTNCLSVHSDGTDSKTVISLRHSHRQFGWGGPVWSPDSRQLLLSEMKDLRTLDVILVDFESGQVSTKKQAGLPVFGWVAFQR